MKNLKKFMAMLMVSGMVLSMVACGGEKEKPASTPETKEEVKEEPKEETEEETEDPAAGEVTPEQQAVVDEYNAMIDRYNEVADAFNADENLKALSEVVAATNEVVAILDELAAEFENVAAFTADDIAAVETLIADTTLFIDDLEALVLNYAGQVTVTIPMVVGNDTGVEIYGLAMSPADDQSWGANLLVETIADQATAETTMTITEETLVWDLLVADSEGNTMEFYGLDFSEVDVEVGAQILLTVAEDGSYVAQFVE